MWWNSDFDIRFLKSVQGAANRYAKMVENEEDCPLEYSDV
jgi:hypothetical protein